MEGAQDLGADLQLDVPSTESTNSGTDDPVMSSDDHSTALTTVPAATDMHSRPSNQTVPHLQELPYLVLSQICDYIEPIWLNSLSNTCVAMRTKLSFEDGNLTWYRALPACILSIEVDPLIPGRPFQLQDRLLGGPYRPKCDYKNEIFGRLADGRRCHVCLRQISGRERQWNVRFCQSCFKKYTITLEEVDSLGVPGVGAALGHLAYPPRLIRNVQRFYRPEIDEIVRNITGGDSCRKTLVNQKQDQMVVKVLLEGSEEEHIRRVARRKIVEYARLIWDGQDPLPNKIYCDLSGELLGTEPHQGMPDANTFREFRERFAPTNKLHEFLYPAYSLSDRPTQLPYQPGDWLEDPALVLTQDNPEVEGDFWYVQRALEMLEALTDWKRPKYYVREPGRPILGGSVTTWLNAAKAYHVDRLENELESGATVNISHTTGALSRSDVYRRIRKLRYLCGLQEQGQKKEMSWPIACFGIIEQVKGRDPMLTWAINRNLTSRLEREKSQRIKRFNKVVRVASVGCPICGHRHGSRGLENSVDDVRNHHPAKFWKSDDWHTVG